LVFPVRSLGLHGVTGYEVMAECDLSGGLPAFTIVGLPDAAVSEARERVRAAIKNCGFTFPVSRITVNLAPAHLKKIGTLSAAEKSGLQRSLTFYRSEKEKNGVLCKVSGSYRGTDPLVRKRLEYFLKGRTDWLYLIPEKIYETIRSNPAGE
jgi:hypothetical protein